MTRLIHQLTGVTPAPLGPLEIAWNTGEVTLLDVATDWTLEIASEPWVDPYAEGSQRELEVIGRKVGLWTRVSVEPGDELARLLGARAIEVEPVLNHFAELVGLDILFQHLVLSARAHDGELMVQVSSR